MKARDRPSAAPARHVRAAQTVPVLSGGSRTMAVVGVGAGIGLLLYPSAANWFAQSAHATEIAGYAEEVEGWPENKRAGILDDAREYNATLAGGTITDAAGRIMPSVGDTAYKDYMAVLDGGQGDTIGRINIPAIGVSLPIYHGTSEESLQRGVGHLFGTDLPVGGEGTHAVLSGHSGLLNAELFTHLGDLKTGDIFSIEVAGDTLYYQVDQITTALPSDTSAVQRIEGEDHVTLVTCTPIGVNTHRLLVRGDRVEGPALAAMGDQIVGDLNPAPGFPWWAVAFVGGTSAVAGASGYKVKRKPSVARAGGVDDGDEVLAVASARGTEWSTEVLDEILARVREALARAAVVSDPVDAARALRALAAVAWEGADTLAAGRPADRSPSDCVLSTAAAPEPPAVESDAAEPEPPVVEGDVAERENPFDDGRIAEPVDGGYRPRHSAPTRVVTMPVPATADGGAASAGSRIDLSAVLAAFDAVIANADRYIAEGSEGSAGGGA